MLSIVKEELGAQSSHSNVLKILLENLLIKRVVHSGVSEGLEGDISGRSPTLDNDLGVNFLLDELLSLSEELTGKDCHSCGSITNFLILSI
jgi:hypothetical protein